MSGGWFLRILGGIGRGLRDGWLLLGITLILFLAVEFGYRGALGVKGALTAGPNAVDSLQHPYAREPWWPQFQRDLKARKNRFDPYRGHWSLPSTSRYVNVDTAGHRITPQPPAQGTPRLVFMLGGSTMWGYSSRDSATIAAFTAAALRARGLVDVKVVSLAQAAYNSTQEATTLVVELAQGHVPAVAVFLDGYNDIATAVKYGEPGHTYGDEGIEQQIHLGTREFWQELFGLGRHSMLVQGLGVRLGIAGSPPKVRGGPKEVCGPLARYYLNLTEAVDALARGYGFSAVFFLQPHHSVSRKPKTPWEAQLRGSTRAVPPCMASIDSALAPRRGTSFFPLGGLFDRDTATVFVDTNAHITEAANRKVAEAIAEVIGPALEPKSRKGSNP